jgi:hypothetical protein
MTLFGKRASQRQVKNNPTGFRVRLKSSNRYPSKRVGGRGKVV